MTQQRSEQDNGDLDVRASELVLAAPVDSRRSSSLPAPLSRQWFATLERSRWRGCCCCSLSSRLVGEHILQLPLLRNKTLSVSEGSCTMLPSEGTMNK